MGAPSAHPGADAPCPASWQGPAPRYLLLAGDASYDVLGRTKGTEADIVPTQTSIPRFSGWTGSDVWYALPDDGPDDRARFRRGPLPGADSRAIGRMVQKTLSYEAQAGDLGWRSDALLVADNDEPGFAEESPVCGRAAGTRRSR